MQIKKSSTILRRLAEMPSDLRELIDSFVSMPLDQLPDALNEFSVGWGRPRGDLCLWISVLNRHDEILKTMVAKYSLDKNNFRHDPFDPADEKLILAVFKFSRFILNYSSNRSIFASEKHIYHFLYVTSPSILLAALEVCVAVAITTSISAKYVHSYLGTSELSVIRKYTTFLSSILGVTSDSASDLVLIDYLKNSNPAPEYSIQFYIHGSEDHDEIPSSITQLKFGDSTCISESNPLRSESVTSALGPQSSTITKERLAEYIIYTKDAIEQPLEVTLKKALIVVPEEFSIDVVLKAFVAKSTSNTEEGAKLRATLIEIQCAALDLIAYSSDSNNYGNKLVATSSQSIRHISQLVLPENDVPVSLKMAALSSLHSMAGQVSIMAEIVLSLSFHVNHGPLMIILRHTIKDLKLEKPVNEEFIDSVTSLILQLAILASNESMVGAASEIIPLLVELIKTGKKIPKVRTYIIETLANMVQDSQSTLTILLQEEKSNKLMISFLQEAVESYMIPENRGIPPKYCNVDYDLSHNNSCWLTSVLHIIEAIATHSRASDRIQILLESPFLGLSTQMAKNPKIFGSIAINFSLIAIGNMLENESSTFAIMSEKNYLDELLDCIPSLLDYSTSFHTPVAKFLSSLAHNETGMFLIKKRNLFPVYFSYIHKSFGDKDGLKHLGSCLDQICTEHTTLRPVIIEECLKLMVALRDAIEIDTPPMHFFQDLEQVSPEEPSKEDIEIAKKNSLLNSSVIFIESLLKNHFSRVEFIKQKGVDTLLSFLELDGLTYDFTYNFIALTLFFALKQLFDLDFERTYVGEAIMDNIAKAILRVELAQEQIDTLSESDLLESPEYQNYLRSLGPLNNILVAFHITVFTNSGTGYRIHDLLESLAKADIADYYKKNSQPHDQNQTVAETRGKSNLIERLGKIQRQALWEDSRITKYLTPAVQEATRAASLDNIYGSFFTRLNETDDAKKLRELQNKLGKEAKTFRFTLIKAGRFLLNGITFTSSKLFYEISGSISLDRLSTLNDKYAFKLIETLALVFVAHMERFNNTDPSEVHMRYLIDVLNCLQKVMYRTFGRSLALCKGLFIFFKQTNGITKMLSILDDLFIKPEANDDDSITAGAIKVLLILINCMISSKSVFENNFLAARTWGQHEDRHLPNFFSSKVFYSECRLTVFNTVIQIWKSESITSKPSSITNLVTSTISSIFSTAGDDSLKTADAGGLSYLNWQESWPAESIVNAYVRLGYSRDHVLEAIYAAGKNNLPETLRPIKLDEITYQDIPDTVPRTPTGLLCTYSDLTAQRFQVLDNALDRALDILHGHPENVFVIASFISKFVSSQANSKSTPPIPLNNTAIKQILESITSMNPKSDEATIPLMSFCHLLGLLLADNITLYSALEDVITFFPKFVEFINIPNAISKKWFPHVLLILETVFVIKGVPDEIPGERFAKRHAQVLDAVICKTSPIPPELTEKALHSLMNIEAFTDELTTLAIARLFAFFTRDFNLAAIFRKSPIFPKLLSTVKEFAFKSTKDDNIANQLRASINILFRNLVETPSIVSEIMTRIITKQLGSQALTPADDIYSFISTHSNLVARSPSLFVNVVGELCTLADPGNSESSFICLKSTYKKRNASVVQRFKEISGDKENDIDIDHTPERHDSDVSMEDSPSQGPSTTGETGISSATKIQTEQDNSSSLIVPLDSKVFDEGSAEVIHLLISELLAIPKEEVFTVPDKTNVALAKYMAQNPSKKEKTEDKKFSKPGFYYACFLIQSLTELVGSYTTCKLAFINYSKNSQSLKATSSLHSSTALDYFFNYLMPCGVLSTYNSFPFNEWSEISSLSSYTILKLLTSADEKSKLNINDDDVQNDPNLLSVRQFTLDAISKTFTEISNSSDNMDLRYSKITALSELCYKLMSSRSGPSSCFDFTSVNLSEGIAVAKIAYEKSFASVLTGVLSKIDLNCPDVRRPVRSLTRSLNKLSRLTMEISNEVNAGKEEEEEGFKALDSMSSRNVAIEDQDLYRNSTLRISQTHDNTSGMDTEVAESRQDENEEMDYEGPSDDNSAQLIAETSELELGDQETVNISRRSSDMIEDEVVNCQNVNDISSSSREHDHHMEDAHNIEELSQDNDWESYGENDDDEEDSQIDAVGNLLHQEEEDGLDQDELNYAGSSLSFHEEDGDDESFLGIRGIEEDGYFPSLFLGDHGNNGFLDDEDGETDDQDNFFLSALDDHDRDNGDTFIGNPLLEEFSSENLGGLSTLQEPFTSQFQPLPDRSSNEQILGQLLQSLQGGQQSRGEGHLELSTLIRPSFGAPQLRRLGRHGDTMRNDRNNPKTTSLRWREASIIFRAFTRTEALRVLVNYIYEKIVSDAMSEFQKVQDMRAAIAAEDAKQRRLDELKEAKELSRISDEEVKAEHEVKAYRKTLHRLREEIEEEDEEGNVEENLPSTSSENQGLGTADTENVSMTDNTEREGNSSRVDQNSILVTIGGREVNVAGLGIDPTFLEALPDEMREEVLTQHLRGLQESANRGDTRDEELVSTFLNVLPDHVRRELVETDTEEPPADASGHHELDTASFFATLDPSLRETLLLEQDDETLSTLPPELVAEARNIRSRTYSRPILPPPMEILERQLGSFGTFTDLTRNQNTPPKKKVVSVASLHLIDKQGVAALIRTLYLPQSSSKRDCLHELLLHLCSNKTTRSDIINLILHILQDSSLDKASLDKGYILTSNRALYGISSSKGKHAAPDYNVLSHEITPGVVTAQILDALDYLVRFSGNVKYFFLSEHTRPIADKPNRKGKEKEDEILREQKFPINILINLLDRSSFRKSMLDLEILAIILEEITKALPILLKPVEVKESEKDLKKKAFESISNKDKPKTDEQKKAPKLQCPPFIREQKLRIISETLTAKDCTNHAFRKLINMMQDLCAIDGVKTLFGNELVSQALIIGPEILSDLNELIELTQNMEKGADIPSYSISKLSSANSNPTKLLRVLTAVDCLFDPARGTNLDKSAKDKANTDFKSLYESMNFGPLWSALGDCLRLLQDRPDLTYIATSLLSLIECLMLVCKHSSVKDAQSKEASKKYEARKNSISNISIERLFFSFTDEHRKILNNFIRGNPKLMHGSFSILIQNPKSLEFDNKRRYFNRKIYQNAPSTMFNLNVRRDQVFLDSYKSLYFKSADEIKYARLNIKFRGEEGVDAGGVTREWYQVLSRQIFNPDYALFSPVASDRTTFHPNRTSWVNPEHLLFFKFIGRIIGKAIYDNKLLDCHFSRAVYKQILGKSVSLKDMETLDLDYYKSLVWMLENDITNIITETFSIDADDYGEQKIIDLKPGGRNIPVSEDNKAEYVKLVVEYRLIESVKDQLNHFLEGFHDIIPKDVISIFDEQELELLISGMPDIDLDDWRNNTEYRNYTASSPQIKWFWRVVRSFDAEEKAKLLQFATGTSKVPLNGFKELVGMHGVSKFTIHRDYGSKDRLPSSHTCFNQIDLPEYDSYETLRGSLLMAITEGKEGFGFA